MKAKEITVGADLLVYHGGKSWPSEDAARATYDIGRARVLSDRPYEENGRGRFGHADPRYTTLADPVTGQGYEIEASPTTGRWAQRKYGTYTTGVAVVYLDKATGEVQRRTADRKPLTAVVPLRTLKGDWATESARAMEIDTARRERAAKQRQVEAARAAEVDSLVSAVVGIIGARTPGAIVTTGYGPAAGHIVLVETVESLRAREQED